MAETSSFAWVISASLRKPDKAIAKQYNWKSVETNAALFQFMKNGHTMIFLACVIRK
jgi:hypothetical protein